MLGGSYLAHAVDGADDAPRCRLVLLKSEAKIWPRLSCMWLNYLMWHVSDLEFHEKTLNTFSSLNVFLVVPTAWGSYLAHAVDGADDAPECRIVLLKSKARIWP